MSESVFERNVRELQAQLSEAYKRIAELKEFSDAAIKVSGKDAIMEEMEKK